jgi:hypothetical protein
MSTLLFEQGGSERGVCGNMPASYQRKGVVVGFSSSTAVNLASVSATTSSDLTMMQAILVAREHILGIIAPLEPAIVK